MSRSVSLDNHIQQGVGLLAPLRRRWLRAYLISWFIAICGMLAIAGTWTVAKEQPPVCWSVTIGMGVGIWFMMYRSSKKGKTLKTSFNKWRADAVKLINSDASLNVDDSIESSSFDDSLLYRKQYNRYHGWNRVRLAELQCSSLEVKYEYQETYYETETYTDSSGRSQTRQVQKTRTVVKPVFDGTMIELPAPVPHPVTLVMQHPDFGGVRNLDKLRPSSPYLNKNYLISVSDQFAGHRMLTPSKQVDIEDFSRNFKYLPGYSYRDDRAYVCLPGYYLSYGACPSKWREVRTAGLMKIVESCEQSLAFLQSVTPRLLPDTDAHTLQAV